MRSIRLRTVAKIAERRCIISPRVSSCLFTSISRVQGAASLAASPTSSNYVPPPTLTSTSASDDNYLKRHFDQPAPRTTSFSSPQGLFLYPPLGRASALSPLTDRTLIHAQAIVDRICRAKGDPTGKELRLVVKNLDRLSDLLCGVIDMCELIRNVHPDEDWIAESERTYERLCSFMNGLNTHVGLYEALVATLEHRHTDPLSPAETQVALTFLRDFEKSGINLPPAIRARFVELSDNLLTLGRTFLSYAASGPPPEPAIAIPEANRLLAGMGSQFLKSLKMHRGTVYVQPGSWEAQMIARYAREGEARRLVYTGCMRADPERVNVLEQMLKERAELASVLGKETWADVVLTDKMAKTPNNVMGFLTSLATHHRSAAAEDVATLQRLKATTITGNSYTSGNGTGHLPPLHAWDRDFFSERHSMTMSPTSSLPPISPYFSTGTALLGLSKLFTSLYGISFKPAPIASGEVWHENVRKLEVVDETEGTIGVIYCDLFSRDGKPPSAAHYTVRCSRRVDDDDLAGDRLQPGWARGLGEGLESAGVTIKGREGKYQLPIVVLTTDFGHVEPGRPALLSWNDLETLFHEMGHAIHSMIGRTEYHNVSGTRCATDFVELPSILMEHFVSSPSVLSLFATHHATGDPLPPALIQAHLQIQRSLSSLETHGQILMAILDQKYHALTAAEASRLDSTAIYNTLQEEIGVIPPVPGTAWQTQFGHLYGYGATYYSYLFDRAIAGKVWSTLFNHTPEGSLSREGGEIFKEKVLKWGGGRDPWVMVGDVIGGAEGEAVSKGDEKAMGLVGGWLTKG